MGRAGPGPGRRGPGHRHGRSLGRNHQRRPASGHLPAGQARTLIDAASAFDNGHTLALAITAIALAAGSAFTYRYLKRQPTTSTEQAQHPELAHNGRQPPEQAGSGRQAAPVPQR